MSTTAHFFTEFIPHGNDYDWLPSILWTTVIADALIATSYFSIPLALFMYVKQKRDFQFFSIALLFATFILFCGITHVIEIYTIWHGNYGIQAIAKLLTALVSFATAAWIFKELPKALLIPTLAEYDTLSQIAHKETLKREQLEAAARERSRLQPQLDRLDRVLRCVNDGLWEWEMGTDKVWFNRSAKQMLGIASEDAGRFWHWEQHIHPDDVDRVLAAVQAHLNENVTYEIFYRGKVGSGEYEWFHTRGALQPAKPGDTAYMSGIITNVQEARTMALELAQKTQALDSAAHQYKAIFDQIAVGIAKVDSNGFIQKANARLAKILGQDTDKLSGQDFIELVHSEDREKCSEELEQLKKETINSFAVEKRLCVSETEYKWTLLTFSLEQDPTHTRQEFLIVVQDIASRKKAQELLQESNAALERFAYVASHDLQEPLRKIVSFSQRLEHKLQGGTAQDLVQFELECIIKASDRMSKMIKSLLNLSRLSNTEPECEWVTLKELVQLACDNLALFIQQHNAKVIVDDENTQCFVEKTLFQQVFQNLISNSIHYRKEIPPVITISTSMKYGQGEIILTDNGVGIDPQKTDIIFTPFKRASKKNKGGQGIGLAICQQVVKLHTGRISAEPLVSKGGSRFIISLPSHRIQLINDRQEEIQ